MNNQLIKNQIYGILLMTHTNENYGLIEATDDIFKLIEIHIKED